jgi:transcriptional regulator with XRE-family HTH domain
MENIGTKIKVAIAKTNYTQKRLENETGIDQHRLSDLINNKKSPTYDELLKISKSMDCSILDLIPLDGVLISNNDYKDNASSIQHYHHGDPSLIKDLIAEIIELKVQLITK